MKAVRVRWLIGVSSLLGLLVLPGCGSEEPGKSSGSAGSGNMPPAGGPLLPWTEGNRWTYRVTQDGVVSDKVTTVGAEEPVGGEGPYADVRANKVTTRKRNGADLTESWQARDGDRVLRYRERSYSASTGEFELEEHWDPYKLHVDGSPERLSDGNSWLEEYEETKLPVGQSPSLSTRRDRWKVVSVAESVTVPAGTFDAVVIQKLGTDTPKTYWYVPGVGKVKETGGQTEELTDYELAP